MRKTPLSQAGSFAMWVLFMPSKFSSLQRSLPLRSDIALSPYVTRAIQSLGGISLAISML